MATDTFGSFAVTTGFTTGYARSTDTTVQTRVCSDGTRPITILELRVCVAGRGASTTVECYIGNADGTYTFAAEANAGSPEWKNITNWTGNSNQSMTYGYQGATSQFYFARSSSSTVGTTGPLGSFTGKVGMGYEYAQSPTAPSFSLTPGADGTEMTVNISAPSSNGDSTLTGYRIQRATNSAFTANLSTTSGTATAPNLVTGLTPGQLYYWRVTARNGVTDAWSVLGGAWAGTQSATQPDVTGVGRYYTGTTFAEMEGRRFNGTTWDELEGRRWDGATWAELGH